MVEQGLTVSMTEYIVLHVLDSVRAGPRLRAAQHRREWLDVGPIAPGATTIAILGLGALGAEAGGRLVDLGFAVRGWSRSRKEIDGIRSFAGEDGLKQCLGGANILICLLPLTDETRGILSASTFAPLAHGAVLIHAARGAHLVETDLLAALEIGRLSRAVVDVFATENPCATMIGAIPIRTEKSTSRLFSRSEARRSFQKGARACGPDRETSDSDMAVQILDQLPIPPVSAGVVKLSSRTACHRLRDAGGKALRP
jgi:lactate dehydrogenase-like 2-hydroxyacid dehydrogenase